MKKACLFFSLFILAACAGQRPAADSAAALAPALECSAEKNRWGHPKECVCGSLESDSDITYDATQGICVRAVHATGACTRDLNEWGHASRCQCPEGSRYNQVNGLCVFD